MIARKLENKETVEVGDEIEHKSFVGTKRYRVHRVTKKYSFVRYNHAAEGKFPRLYDWSFKPYPKDTWSTVEYTVYRPVEDKPN